MNMVVLSDTFGHLPKISGNFDFFIHAGNFSPHIGNDQHNIELTKQSDWMEEFFCPWFKSINAKYKILMPGHNDYVAQYFSRDLEKHIGGIYLQDEATTIEKTVFYGMPWLPPDAEKYIITDSRSDPVFVSPSKRHFQAACKKIPEETNVLITRIAPKGVFDKMDGVRIGDAKLLERLEDLSNLKAHIFGFSNDSCASKVVRKDVLFANAHVKKEENGWSVLQFELQTVS